jgi:hypothetical protein
MEQWRWNIYVLEYEEICDEMEKDNLNEIGCWHTRTHPARPNRRDTQLSSIHSRNTFIHHIVEYRKPRKLYK